jgi:hypothetical protein
MKDDEMKIKYSDPEPDSFDDFLWWVFVSLSIVGTLTMCTLLIYFVKLVWRHLP